jgi:hypothetical protein
MVTRFCLVVPNICRFSVWNLLHVNLLVPKCLEDFCTPGCIKFMKNFSSGKKEIEGLSIHVMT